MLEFSLALTEVSRRFEEALAKHTFELPHWKKGTHPVTLHPLAVFTLAEGYDLMLEGRSEQITLGVPIVSYDNPVHLTDGDYEYFVVGRPGELGSRHTVRLNDYDRLFNGSGEPPVVDFLNKVMTYEVVESAHRT